MPISTIVKRNGETATFDRNKIAVAIYKAAASVGGHDRELTERLAGEVVEALEATYSGDNPPTVEDIQDVVERVLIERGHARTAKAYILYRHERARMRAERRGEQIEFLPYKAMWQALDWAVEHRCHTVGQLNAIVEAGRLPELIAAADGRYEAALDEAAEAILDRRDRLRFIIVAGPSSSGKTTTTLKISERLAGAGIEVVPLALDNYFFDLELHPRDEHGDYDYETPEALDLPLVNRHLAELDRGHGIDMPIYDFESGRRLDETRRFEPAAGSLILLDSLHGLYDGLTESVSGSHKLRIYIETISQLKNREGRYVRWTDLRLLRRLVRDARSRNHAPERTIQHWHYVRRAELKHIIPFQGRADYQINGSLAYELPFLKLHAFHHFPGFLARWADDERHLDGYLRARRIHDLLESIAEVADDALVPADSLLREFIGGSAYPVH